MKFNWGTGITIAIMMFMAFIIVMAVKMASTQTDLYAPDYYAQELSYQQRIDARNNTEALTGKFDVQLINEESLKINFPIEFSKEYSSGTIQLYRPDNASLDKVFDIKIKQNEQIIPLELLTNGRYTLKILCTHKNEEYYYEKMVKI